MTATGVNVLGRGFEGVPQGQLIKRRLRGESIDRRALGLGAITKTTRSGRGRENVVRVPGQSIRLHQSEDGS